MFIYSDPRTKIKYISYIDTAGKRIRKSLHTKSKAVATIKAAEMMGRKPSGEDIITLNQFLLKYRAYLKATKSKQTGEIFESALRKLLKFKPIFLLTEINPVMLDELQIHLKNNGSGNCSINRTTRALRTAMKQAEYWQSISPHDWQRIVKLRENKGRLTFHTPEELTQILQICPSLAWKLVVLLGARAGLRRGEIAALKWEDVDFKNNQLYVAPNKTENHRYVPLADDLKKALAKAYKGRKNAVFVVNVGDTASRKSHSYLSAYYRKATAQLPFNCFIHKLRHTFASHLVQAGVDLYRVKNLMGHSSITMTEIYAHLAPQDLKSAVQALPDLTEC